MRLRVDYTGTHHVVRIRIDAVEQLHAETGKLVLGTRQVKWNLSLEHFLSSLLLAKS